MSLSSRAHLQKREGDIEPEDIELHDTTNQPITIHEKDKMKRVTTESATVAMAATAAAALIAVGFLLWRQKRRQKTQYSLDEMVIPTKWRKVGEVSELLLYPLKGGKRKCVDKAHFTRRGLREMELSKFALQDRVFVVYNENLEFISVKKNTIILFVETAAVDKSSVMFSFPDADDLIVSIPNDNSNLTQIKFPTETVGTVDCGDEAAKWFSERLLKKPEGLRLGCFIKSLVPTRTIEGSYEKHSKVYTKFHDDYFGAYADVASYMLMGEESLNELNNRLDKPVNEHHFRPNIMVRGSSPYSEDQWDWVRLGNTVVLRGFMYCTRCVVTSINPETAEKDPTTEPLRTLRKYRLAKEPHVKKLEGNSPVMGLYLGCHVDGTVRVGDPVYINSD